MTRSRSYLPEDHPRLFGSLSPLVGGILAALGFAPHSLWPAWLAGVILFLLSAARGGVRWGAWCGFLFGLGHFTLGFSWLLTSIHVHGGIPMPVAVILLVLLAAVMALYTALLGALLPMLAPRPLLMPLVAPALWVVTEWLRGTLFTGFPWNSAAYVWEGWGAVSQLAALGSVPLLSWLAVFIPALLVAIMIPPWRVRRGVALLGIAALTLAAAQGAGAWLLRQELPVKRVLHVSLIQGNIPQQHKWDKNFREETLQRYVELSRVTRQPVDLVVWPETALPFFPAIHPEARFVTARLSRELGAPILTGVPMADLDPEKSATFANSLVLLDDSPDLTRRYDKHHLVPFGEYLPFRQWMPKFLEVFTQATGDFTPGPGPRPLNWDKARLGPLICYEAIFPEEVRELANQGVELLINVTNDGWFGEAAKYQHLAMARLRAIESGLPLVRVANTGVSAVFDAHGKLLGQIDSNATLAATLAVPLNQEETFYRQWGNWALILSLLLLLVILPWSLLRRGRGHLDKNALEL